MKLLGLEVIEYSAVPQDEAWVVRRKDATNLPSDLLDRIQIPCIVTGNIELLRQAIVLMRLTNMIETPDDSAPVQTERSHIKCLKSRRRLREQRRTRTRSATTKNHSR
ncbi:MAG: hypothetical protein M3458_00695 [Acidobacteriota bacterium]|nr:hypothetical protein [Acidobacteriota bacterium]